MEWDEGISGTGRMHKGWVADHYVQWVAFL